MYRLRGIFVVALAACGGGSGKPKPDALVIPSTGVDVPLGSLQAFSYTAAQTIGTQTFTQIVDTGSTTMGVAASTCSTCGVTPLYKPGATAMDLHQTASTQYADMSGWSGEVIADKTYLPGLPTVDQDFVAISTQNMFFDANMYQGILGFSPSVNAEPNTNGFMDLETKAGVTYEMAFRLCPTTGDMWIGGFDPAAGSGTVQYTPMLPIDGSNNPFYSVQISDMSLGSADLGFTTADFGITIVDTGTSVSEVPTPAENTMLAAVNGNAAFKALFPNQTLADTQANDCVTATGVTSAMVDAMLPPFSYSFPTATGGTFKVTLAPSRSYMAPAGNGMFCWGFTSSGSDAASAGSLIGDTTLAGMLTVFDVTHMNMGFATEQGCAEAMIALHPRISEPGNAAPPVGSGHWYEQDPFYRPPPRRPTAK